MKPPPFEYVRCGVSEDALHVLADRQADAMVLAGGQSLLPRLFRRTRRAKVLVDVARAADMIGVEVSDGTVKIGASTPMAEAELAVGPAAPMLATALHFVASPGVRNRGTVGGSAAHADPAAEVPTVLTALNARMTLASRRGVRVVDAADFYLGRHVTARAADELLTGIELAAPAVGEHDAWLELSPRHGDLPLVGVGVRVGVIEGAIVGGRLAVGGAGSRPDGFDLPPSAIGEPPHPEVLGRVAAELAEQAYFQSDERAGAAFRRRVTEVMWRRALIAAAERCA